PPCAFDGVQQGPHAMAYGNNKPVLRGVPCLLRASLANAQRLQALKRRRCRSGAGHTGAWTGQQGMQRFGVDVPGLVDTQVFHNIPKLSMGICGDDLERSYQLVGMMSQVVEGEKGVGLTMSTLDLSRR